MKTASVLLLLLVASLGVVSAEWQILHRNLATIVMGVDFVSDNVGSFAGAINGFGPAIFHTKDGGATLDQQVQDPFSLPGIIMDFVTNLDNTNQSVAVGLGGWFGLLGPGGGYTLNGGADWLASEDQFYLAVAYQDSQVIENTVILTGSWYNISLEDNGVGLCVSEDGGASYAKYDWGIPGSDGYTDEPARYSSFINKNVGWVAGGHWPASVQQDVLGMKEANFAFSQYIKLPVDPELAAHAERTYAGYRAVIAKTTDGGKTYTILFDNAGDYYFNQIAMVNETDGCAVAEGADAYVLCTRNGGETWDITFQEPSMSVIAIEMLDELHGWVAATDFSTGVRAVFFETFDGGRTWNRVDMEDGLGHLVMNMSFGSSRTGYASAINLGNSSSTFKYTA